MEHHLTYRQKFLSKVSKILPKKSFYEISMKISHFFGKKAHDLLRGDKIGQTQNFIKKG